MIDKISSDRSLMYIQQHHIESFCSVADKMHEFRYIIKESSMAAEEDIWNIVFTIWLLLLPDKYKIIESAEKSLYYSSAFIILNILKNDPHFQALRNRSNGTEELNYLASLIIAKGINAWILNVTEKHKITDIIERNKTRIFFESHKESKQEVQTFLQDQAKFVKAAIKELNSSNSFAELIKQCCNDACVLHIVHFGQQNNSGKDKYSINLLK